MKCLCLCVYKYAVIFVCDICIGDSSVDRMTRCDFSQLTDTTIRISVILSNTKQAKVELTNPNPLFPLSKLLIVATDLIPLEKVEGLRCKRDLGSLCALW